MITSKVVWLTGIAFLGARAAEPSWEIAGGWGTEPQNPPQRRQAPPARKIAGTDLNFCDAKASNQNKYDTAQCDATELSMDQRKCVIDSKSPECTQNQQEQNIKLTQEDYEMMLDDSDPNRAFLWQMEAYLDHQQYAYKPCVVNENGKEKCFRWFKAPVEALISSTHQKLKASSEIKKTTELFSVITPSLHMAYLAARAGKAQEESIMMVEIKGNWTEFMHSTFQMFGDVRNKGWLIIRNHARAFQHLRLAKENPSQSKRYKTYHLDKALSLQKESTADAEKLIELVEEEVAKVAKLREDTLAAKRAMELKSIEHTGDLVNITGRNDREFLSMLEAKKNMEDEAERLTEKKIELEEIESEIDELTTSINEKSEGVLKEIEEKRNEHKCRKKRDITLDSRARVKRGAAGVAGALLVAVPTIISLAKGDPEAACVPPDLTADINAITEMNKIKIDILQKKLDTQLGMRKDVFQAKQSLEEGERGYNKLRLKHLHNQVQLKDESERLRAVVQYLEYAAKHLGQVHSSLELVKEFFKWWVTQLTDQKKDSVELEGALKNQADKDGTFERDLGLTTINMGESAIKWIALLRLARESQEMVRDASVEFTNYQMSNNLTYLIEQYTNNSAAIEHAGELITATEKFQEMQMMLAFKISLCEPTCNEEEITEYYNSFHTDTCKSDDAYSGLCIPSNFTARYEEFLREGKVAEEEIAKRMERWYPDYEPKEEPATADVETVETTRRRKRNVAMKTAVAYETVHRLRRHIEQSFPLLPKFEFEFQQLNNQLVVNTAAYHSL